MDDKLKELEATITKLRATETRRANLIEYRDRQLAELRAAGTTWAKLQQITGLTAAGLKKALDRTTP